MWTWIPLAFRNILKNRRRSLVTLLAIGIGFAALGLFRGYTHNVYSGLRQSAVHGEGLGHLTFYKRGWLERGQIDPGPLMFTPSELHTLRATVAADAAVLVATPQLWVSGLVSNGRISTIFMAKGVLPREDRTLTGPWASRRALHGESVHEEAPAGVEMAQELARLLELRPGDTGVAMTTTLEGQMNALDLDVRGVYDTGATATNDKWMRVPLAFAQALLQTEQVDRVVVLLNDWQQTVPVRDRLLQRLTALGLQVESQTWQELSVSYLRVKNLFDMIFLFLSTIVVITVGMSVVNTMGMAVVERSREIGTLRALGVQRRQIVALFATEGALLGGLGVGLGLGLHLVVWALMQGMAPTYTPPMASAPVPLLISLVPASLAKGAGLLLGLTLLAAIVPARHAAQHNIIDALGHV